MTTALKLGEVQSEMSADVKRTDELKVLLRVGWSDKMKEVTFKPAEDLKKGDKIRITVERMQ
ncbi:MAG: hypothetical protein QUS33_05490 [Dehalococcoidia bacterium]|nr:hypothetical protein [Dehalococcoidia bacterium]